MLLCRYIHGEVQDAYGEKGEQQVSITLACGDEEQKKTSKTDAAACSQPAGPVCLSDRCGVGRGGVDSQDGLSGSGDGPWVDEAGRLDESCGHRAGEIDECCVSIGHVDGDIGERGCSDRSYGSGGSKGEDGDGDRERR